MKKIEPLFQVDTFEEIVKNTKEVHKNLKSLGCFQAVNIEVDTLPDPSQEIYQVPLLKNKRFKFKHTYHGYWVTLIDSYSGATYAGSHKS